VLTAVWPLEAKERRKVFIMNKARRIVIAGIGAMTPGFIATDQVQARAADDGAIAPVQSGAQSIPFDQEALKSALLGLSPTEKLRIAGDRIRLAKSNVQSTSKAAGAAKQYATAGAQLCVQPPKPPRPQGKQAR
jgi:hypothetical protein